MTQKKQLKARVRARMARTGESYVTALRHVTAAASPGSSASSGRSVTTVGPEAPGTPDAPLVDHGYTLRGGVHPESANIAHVLAHHGIATAAGGAKERPISEALVFGIAGGPGAGYILWEFKQHATATLVMAFHNSWQYPDKWHAKALDRLGVRYLAEHSGGAGAAARRLTQLLREGRPCIIRPDRFHLGYWRLPDFMDGRGGADVVVYAEDAAGVHVDDRNVSALVVPRERLDAARARVGSYKNSLYAIDPATGQIPAETLRAAVQAGLEDCVEHLSSPSDSFSLPAWRKWARLLVDEKNAKAWPRVFAGREGGLAGALLSVWEGVVPAGGYGGHLRDLYADFLDEAAAIVDNPALREVAGTFRAIGERWQAVAETALPDEVAPFATLRDRMVAVHQAVVDPAAVTPEEADQAAADLWSLRAELDRDFPLDDGQVRDLFGRLSAVVEGVYEAETAAVAQLAGAIGGT